MDLPEYKKCLAQVRSSHVSLTWRSARLSPLYDSLKTLIGWRLIWVGVFADKHFVRVKEHWQGTEREFTRKFFSYHYGPYHPSWDLDSVKCKTVIVRVDAVSYHGRGFHIHDGAKDRRIFQDSLKSPILSDLDVADFLKAVASLRLGQSVRDAFQLQESEP